MAKPNYAPEKVRVVLRKHGVTETPCVLAIRGYYRDSMGEAGKNDRGIYDDALFIVLNDRVLPYNGNTDPSVYREHIAVLKPGVWTFRAKKHKIASPSGYAAFGQSKPVTVIRDKKGADTGLFGINLHRGGLSGTSSLGCQTVPVNQWNSFRDELLKALGLTTAQVMASPSGVGPEFPFVLVTREKLDADPETRVQ